MSRANGHSLDERPATTARMAYKGPCGCYHVTAPRDCEKHVRSKKTGCYEGANKTMYGFSHARSSRRDRSTRGKGANVESTAKNRREARRKLIASGYALGPETEVPTDVLAAAFESARDMLKNGDRRSQRAALAFVGKFLRTTPGPTQSNAAAGPEPPAESKSDELDEPMTVERAARLRSQMASHPQNH